MQSTTIGSNQAGQRLDKFLHKYLPDAGTGFLYKMLRKKNITLNGKKAEGSELLKEGDSVSFFFSQETFEKFAGKTAEAEPDTSEYEKAYRQLKGIQVIYEDENFLFLNKPAGILTQKARPEDSSLNEWLIGYLLQGNPAFIAELAAFHPSVCNRLDRNTSGIVLCGKSLPGLQFLSKCIKERSVRKFYHTICVGELREEALIRGYLHKDERRNRVYISEKKDSAAKQEQSYIETGYRPLNAHRDFTYLEVELITGKTHQIRASMAGKGHPLIGDFKYGQEKLNRSLKQKYGLNCQLLHAYRIIFPEIAEGIGKSVSGREFTAPEPEQFAALKTALNLS